MINIDCLKVKTGVKISPELKNLIDRINVPRRNKLYAKQMSIMADNIMKLK